MISIVRRRTQSKPRRGWAAPLLAGAALLAGCGGAVTKREVVTRADAICANTLRDIRAVPAPADTSTASLARYFARIAPIVQHEATQVRKLPRAAQERQLLNRWVSSVTLTAADYRALANAARIGDSQAINAAEAALRASDAPSLAARYGLGVCTGSAGTAVAS